MLWQHLAWFNFRGNELSHQRRLSLIELYCMQFINTASLEFFHIDYTESPSASLATPVFTVIQLQLGRPKWCRSIKIIAHFPPLLASSLRGARTKMFQFNCRCFDSFKSLICWYLNKHITLCVLMFPLLDCKWSAAGSFEGGDWWITSVAMNKNSVRSIGFEFRQSRRQLNLWFTKYY